MTTATAALVHHFPVLAHVREESILDAARSLGVLSLCMGCGSVVTCALKDEEPVPEPFVNFEAYRVAYSKFLRADDEDALSCCPDSDTILY